MKSLPLQLALLFTLSVVQAQEPARMETRSVNKVIHVSSVLRCSPDHAFAYFTENKPLDSWLTAVAEVEPRAGGKYELFWEPADRENNSTIGCKVTAVEKDRFISFEWRSPKQFKHFANNADPLTHGTVFFIPRGDSTEVHLIHSGWRSSPDWEQARLWQLNAWTLAFRRLEENVNGK